MTGFGRATASLGNQTLVVQVSAVNRKALDLTVKLPPAWSAFESVIGELVRDVATRGKIHVEVALTGAAVAAGGWDDNAAGETLDRLAELAEQQGVPFTATPDLLWQIVSSQRVGSEPPALEDVEDTVHETVTEALRAFIAMRASEGESLLVDFLGRLEAVKQHAAAVAERAPAVAPAYRDVLLKRLRDADLDLDVNDERVLKEIALFADRCDITEEITRLRSHFTQLEQLLRSGGEIGRKAEFILQEIGREIHTIGSKANDLAISKHVIELKNELERIREQIANVE